MAERINGYPEALLRHAEAIVGADKTIDANVLSIFPNASPDDIAEIKQLLAVDMFMEGVEFAEVLAQSGANVDDLPTELNNCQAGDCALIDGHVSLELTFCPYRPN